MTRMHVSVGNERTALAWQRTALALLAGGAVVARLTLDRLGVFAVASLALELPLVLWVMVESRGRYHHDAGIRERGRPRGGRATAALAVAVVVIAVTELSALAVSARS